MEENERDKPETGEGGSAYLGNTIPKFLPFVYVAFVSWAIFYVVKNLIPDLIRWLK